MTLRRIARAWTLVCQLVAIAACSFRDWEHLSSEADNLPSVGKAGASASSGSGAASGRGNSSGPAGAGTQTGGSTGSGSSSGKAGAADAGSGAGSANTRCGWFPDVDGDGYGDRNADPSCDFVTGYIDNNSDCDDEDSKVSPAASELCDGVDGDCNPSTKESCLNGCTPESYAGHRYLVCTDLMPYWLAKDLCAAEGMWLLRVDNAAENDHFVASLNGYSAWIGGTDSRSEANWEWSDGKVFWRDGASLSGHFTNWGIGEPNARFDFEDCLELRSVGYWNDQDCEDNLRFICERY